MSTAGHSARALDQLEEVIRLDPDFGNAYWRRFNVRALHGTREDAEAALRDTREGIYPGKSTEMAEPCWGQYLLARLERIPAEGALSDEACIGIMHDFRARLHGALGQVDDALEYSRRALEEGASSENRGATIHLFYPEMAEARGDPRFWALADGVGLVDFWRGYGRWPDFCYDRAAPMDCPAMADAAVAARNG